VQRKIKETTFATFDFFMRTETGIFNAKVHYILNVQSARFRNERFIYYIERKIILNVAWRQTGYSPMPTRFDKTSFILALH